MQTPYPFGILPEYVDVVVGSGTPYFLKHFRTDAIEVEHRAAAFGHKAVESVAGERDVGDSVLDAFVPHHAYYLFYGGILALGILVRFQRSGSVQEGRQRGQRFAVAKTARRECCRIGSLDDNAVDVCVMIDI